MIGASFENESDFSVGAPEKLFEGSYVTGGNLATHYDVSDDERLLMITKSDDAEVQLICVHNWFEELKQLAPTEK